MTDSQPCDVLVVDMSTLRYRVSGNRSAVRLTTQSGLFLAVVHPRIHEDSHDVAFRAMDDALRQATALWVDPANPRARRVLRLALYNPLSGDVSFEAVPKTVSFNCDDLLALGIDGTPGTIARVGARLTLDVAGVTLAETSRSVSQLTRVIAGHAAA